MHKEFSKKTREEIKLRLLVILEKCAYGHKTKFANTIGHSTGNVEAWFNVKGVALPSIKAMYALVTVYRINLNWLVCGEGNMFINERSETNVKLLNENEFLKGQISAYEKVLKKIK